MVSAKKIGLNIKNTIFMNNAAATTSLMPRAKRIEKPYKLVFIAGTRPEFIKIAPVIVEAMKYPEQFNVVIVNTGQHKEMGKDILPAFGISDKRINYKLEVMKHGQLLEEQFGTMIAKIGRDVLLKEKPDMVVVQGDTTTCLAATFAAIFHDIPVAYIEAGLRTYNNLYPYPEEYFRKLACEFPELTLYLCPSARAVQNLLNEGKPKNKIKLVGNTVIDALNYIKNQPADLSRLNLPKGKKIVLFTCHRREVWGHGAVPGHGLKGIFGVIKVIAKKYADNIHIVYPVHMNPAIMNIAQATLGNIPNVQLIEPLTYSEIVQLMIRSYLIITDSGGIQEEGAALGKPVLIIRNETERPELVKAGVAKLVGIDMPEELEMTIEELLKSEYRYKEMAWPFFPYGTGDAAIKIIKEIKEYFSLPLFPEEMITPVSSIEDLKSHLFDTQLLEFIYRPREKESIVPKVQSAVNNAVSCLISSGIQNNDGSFSGYYDREKLQYTFAYPEITGYGILSLLEQKQKSDVTAIKQECIKKARAAADWLISEMKEAGAGKAVPARHYYNKDFEGPDYQRFYFAFDNGIVLNALIQIFKETREMKYLVAAKQIASFLLDTLKIGSNEPFACYDPNEGIPGKRAVNPMSDWSTNPGAFLAKISEGLLNMFGETGEEKYLYAAENLCDRALKFQQKDGRFITSPKGEDTHAHPHCYSAEGLLFAAQFLKKAKHSKTKAYLTAAAKATKWLLDNMTPAGKIKYLFENGKFLQYERSDVLAQALYLGTKLVNEISELDQANISAVKPMIDAYKNVELPILANHLIDTYQILTSQMTLFDDNAMNGGFVFGTDYSGKLKMHDVNAWCTIFAIKALQAYKDLMQNREGK